jgi:hypothetical protein
MAGADIDVLCIRAYSLLIRRMAGEFMLEIVTIR